MYLKYFLKGGYQCMLISSFLKQDKKCGAFLKSLKRIISKGSNKKGTLFIGISETTGKIIIHKGFIVGSLEYLGTITSKAHYKDLITMLEGFHFYPADESNIPEEFSNMKGFIFYVLSTTDQERFKF